MVSSLSCYPVYSAAKSLSCCWCSFLYTGSARRCQPVNMQTHGRSDGVLLDYTCCCCRLPSSRQGVMHRHPHPAQPANETGTSLRLKIKLLYIRSSSLCPFLCTASVYTPDGNVHEDKSMMQLIFPLHVAFINICTYMLCQMQPCSTSSAVVECACADDVEVRRHWAPGSLTTDAQTVGLPTGRGILQTGAANHVHAGTPGRQA